MMYDNHTLYVRYYSATLDQLKVIFNNALINYNKNHNKNTECSFYYNLIIDRNGESYGIAFIYVSNSQVYNMILGKNPNGTERIKYLKEKKTKIIDKKINWGDSDDDDEIIGEVRLEPLMSLESLINEQGDLFNINVSRAMINKLEDKYVSNILKTKKIPNWVDALMIKNIFAPFASDNKTQHSRVIKGKKIFDTYPFININKEGICFVIYDIKTTDAQFALHMLKKITLTKDDNSITLIFNHSYNLNKSFKNTNNDEYIDENKYLALQYSN